MDQDGKEACYFIREELGYPVAFRLSFHESAALSLSSPPLIKTVGGLIIGRRKQDFFQGKSESSFGKCILLLSSQTTENKRIDFICTLLTYSGEEHVVQKESNGNDDQDQFSGFSRGVKIGSDSSSGYVVCRDPHGFVLVF